MITSCSECGLPFSTGNRERDVCHKCERELVREYTPEALGEDERQLVTQQPKDSEHLQEISSLLQEILTTAHAFRHEIPYEQAVDHAWQYLVNLPPMQPDTLFRAVLKKALKLLPEEKP